MGVALAALHELREVKQMEIAKTANFCELFLARRRAGERLHTREGRVAELRWPSRITSIFTMHSW